MKVIIALGFLALSATTAATPVYVNQAEFDEIIDFTLIADFCKYAAPELGLKSKRGLAERMVMVDSQTGQTFKANKDFLDEDSKNNKAKSEANPEKGKVVCLMMVGAMKKFNAKYGVE